MPLTNTVEGFKRVPPDEAEYHRMLLPEIVRLAMVCSGVFVCVAEPAGAQGVITWYMQANYCE